MNRSTVEINNKKYNLTTTEPEWYLQELATEINRNLNGIITGTKISHYDGLVLLLINYADKARKNADSSAHLRNQLQAYMDESSAIRAELSRVKRELDTLKQGK